MSEIIVGLNPGVHDASAALVVDGNLIACVEEERFTRTKRALWEPPVNSLSHVLEVGGISLDQVDAVALGWDLDSLSDWQDADVEERRKNSGLAAPERLFPREMFDQDGRFPPLFPVAHHEAHAASTYFMSGLEDAAVVVIDNRGEDTGTSIWHGEGSSLKEVVSYPVAHSLGLFYRAACVYSGLYSADGAAGKLMGLAPYGQAKYDLGLRWTSTGPRWTKVEDVAVRNRVLHHRRTEQLLELFEREAFPYARGLVEDVTAYTDFAASVQGELEDVVLDLLRHARYLTGSSQLALAGGVALNCTMNGRIASDSPFDEVFVQPMSSDAGVALGAALAISAKRGVNPRRAPMTHAYWGPLYDDAYIENAVVRSGLEFEKVDASAVGETAAELIAEGAVVGWFQGRAEVGPRALGSRSILGDPRRRDNLVRINSIKSREMWRPLAPSVLSERWHDYFVGTPNPFMIQAATVKHEVRSSVPAVVHIDGSARPQSVGFEHPRYRDAIEAFDSITGVPLLLNTSFNGAGAPIVNTPEEAIDTFHELGLDALVIGRCLLRSPAWRAGS